MRLRLLAVLLTVAATAAAAPVLRHYDTSDGLSHRNIRDIMQDSAGYMWFATWTGVDRFDGYEFRNFRSFPSDAVKLDNNRIERLAADPDGNIVVETYSGHRYRLDPVAGTFNIAGDCTGLAFGKDRPTHRPRPELAEYPVDSPQSYVDRDGNLWIARNGGIDFVTTGNPAFTFLDSTPLDSIGADIHAVYAAPDGRIWAASRDTRIMIYDNDGTYIGNLTPAGRIVPDPSAASGVKAYSFMADADGRMWIGTKSQRLLILSPREPLDWSARQYLPGDTPGSLQCADIYDIKADNAGRIWLATFGGGIARTDIASDGSISFAHKAPSSPGKGMRVRRLQMLPDGLMMAAATDGVAVFNPDDELSRPVFFNRTESSRGSSLSTDDVLDMTLAGDNTIYLSTFSGGIDFVHAGTDLLSDSIVFGHRNIRDGLCVDPVLSLIEDTAGSLWVVSTFALARYDAQWRLMSVFNGSNLGRDVEFTEAKPQLLHDGRIVFGISGGLLIVDPSRLGTVRDPVLVVNSIDSPAGTHRPDSDGILRLQRGCRDITLRFAALQYDGADAVRYAWRRDDGEWADLGHERTLRLSSLPAGTSTIYIRSTDPYGRWADNTIGITVEIPRTVAEITYICLIVLCAIAILVLAFRGAVKASHTRARRRMLARCLDTALRGTAAPAGIIGRVAAEVGSRYADENLKAEHLAAALGMPRNELRRLVKQAIGISVEDFVRFVRVGTACRMLDSGCLTVAEAAYRCGFRTPQYMSMVFKEQTGLTPGEYLRKSRSPGRKSCK